MPQTPTQQRAAQAVASWLAANEQNPTWLVQAAGVDPGTIGDFLNGQRWPKTATQGKIEAALGWPAGSIRQIGAGGDPKNAGIHAPAGSESDPAPGAMAIDELMAGLLRARAETDRLRDDVRDLTTRVTEVEAQLHQGSEHEADVTELSVRGLGVGEAQSLAARTTGRKSRGQQHRAHLDEAGQDNQDAGDTDPA